MTRTVRIHGARGIVERAPTVVPDRSTVQRTRTVADTVPITEIMSRDLVCAFADLGCDRVIEIMMRERLGCMPVIDDDGHPLGMVTKLDLVEHLARPHACAVADVMMPLAITLDDDATVGHAAALMAAEDMHHVMIVAEGRLVGVVSTMDVTRWLANNDGMPR